MWCWPSGTPVRTVGLRSRNEPLGGRGSNRLPRFPGSMSMLQRECTGGAAKPSLVREFRFPFLNEGRHPFLLVGDGKLGMEHAPLEADAFGKRGFVGAIDRLLGHHG